MAHLESGVASIAGCCASGLRFAERCCGKEPGDQSVVGAFTLLLPDLLFQATSDFPRMAQIAAGEKMGKALDILIGQF
jgi:hypothetical protein